MSYPCVFKLEPQHWVAANSNMQTPDGAMPVIALTVTLFINKVTMSYMICPVLPCDDSPLLPCLSLHKRVFIASSPSLSVSAQMSSAIVCLCSYACVHKCLHWRRSRPCIKKSLLLLLLPCLSLFRCPLLSFLLWLKSYASDLDDLHKSQWTRTLGSCQQGSVEMVYKRRGPRSTVL